METIKDIGCIDCSNKVAEITLQEVEVYKGDNYYGFRCSNCQDLINQQNQE